MRKWLFLAILATSLISCEKNKEYCWQVYDNMGNQMGIICDKTEAEIAQAYGQFYDRADAVKFCWKVTYSNGTSTYVENLTEKMVNMWHGGGSNVLEKVVCGYCQWWHTREKGVLKSSGSFAYKPIVVRQYCGDTCSTLFPGRSILLRETVDSLIYHEFIQKQ